MANTIGTAYIQIEPTTKGISGSIANALDGEASAIGASAGGKLSSALGAAAKVGVAAIAGATTAMTAFGAESVKVGAEFDSSMSQVAATMGFSVSELNTQGSEAQKTFQQLRDFAQEMGNTTAFSASESAEALNYMALAGYDAETSMKMLPNVLNLAASGGIGLADASNMITDAQTALGLSLDDTSKMVDEMAKAASSSNATVSELGEAYLTIGANARSLSGGTNELATMIGILSDNGIHASEAGTHLRNIMLAMNPTTDKAVNAWEKLGVSAYDADGNLRPLQDTFGDLSSAMEGMTEQEKTDILSKMFNKTDLAAINALLGTSTERFDELSQKIKDSAGAAEEMAGVQLDNLSGDITFFQSALEGAKIAVSDGLTPTLREFVQFGSDGLSELTKALKEDGFEGAINKAGEILGDLVNKIISLAPKMMEAGIKLIESLLKGIQSNISTLTDAVVKIVELFAKFIIENLPMVIDTGIKIILSLAQAIADNIDNLIPSIIACVEEIVSVIMNNLDMIIDVSIKIISALAKGLVDNLPTLAEKVPEIITKIINTLTDHLPEIVEFAGELVVQLGVGLIKALPVLIQKAPELVVAIIKGIKTARESIKDAGKDIVNGLWEGIKANWDNLVNSVKNAAGSLVGGLREAFRIGSPSKVFRDEIGQWIPAGIAVGIEDNTDVLDDSMKTMQGSLDPSNFSMSTDYSANYDVSANTGYEGIIALLSEYLPQISNMQIMLDGGALVGATAPAMNTELGRISAREGRR